ncbi:MAG: DUF305 domain-containing protein [Gemmatimonadaceae bacterium]|nr:DUF305 domain-containing protein [Gemmatimonadaceae bacterium]
MRPKHTRDVWLAIVALGLPLATSAAQAPDTADVAFMRGMIGHHAQAVTMTAMIAERTTNPRFRLLGERIAVSQQDEIATMRRWLASRGMAEPAATGAQSHAQHGVQHGAHAMAHGDHAMMPGMLTPAELDSLAASRGTAFEQMFLRKMIRHHEGALAMVAALFARTGAAQDAEVFAFASDVDADQRAEIRRMTSMLDTRTTRRARPARVTRTTSP